MEAEAHEEKNDDDNTKSIGHITNLPFTYADLLPAPEENLTVTIHKRTRHESSQSCEDKQLFFPVPDVKFQG